jgi:hypothetical protein
MDSEKTRSGICSISLTLLGNHLDPHKVTETLGMEPDKSWRKGDRASKDPAILCERKSGIWEVTITPPIDELTPRLIDLLTTFNKFEAFSDMIPEVEQAKLWILVFGRAEAVNLVEIEMCKPVLALMAKLGVEFYMNVGLGIED